METTGPVVAFGEFVSTELLEVTQDPSALTEGWWAIAQTFEGEFYGFRFARPVQQQINAISPKANDANGLARTRWNSNISQCEYEDGVEQIREAIARGWVYQTNYCRVLSQQIPDGYSFLNLYQDLLELNPAPFSALFSIPKSVSGLPIDINLASASPELFIERIGQTLKSSPIKGTAKLPELMLEKDGAENIMIVDLIRNDLSHVCKPGTVAVPQMLRIEEHPGLAHLVSDVTGELSDNQDWAAILQAMCPPGSVSGAPKSSSLQLIAELEPSAREIYCGTIGWIDVDKKSACLSVAIRTFWQSLSDEVPTICFGTGAGITYDSDPFGEWLETELKAEHLLNVASTAD